MVNLPFGGGLAALRIVGSYALTRAGSIAW